jgi:hypothetical protein
LRDAEYHPDDYQDIEYREPEFREDQKFKELDYHSWPTPGPTISQVPLSPKSIHSTGGSALASPRSIQSPQPIQESDKMAVSITERQDENETRQSITDRRNEKRKMKRFRLTHNQTRFLMSEFARQAHPDAAHRERLAREIPGLSPRQVQVWFQNRRAKLKRMSSDDRERMMKSRALPDEFPILQTLHSYNGRMMETPMASPTDYSPTSANAYNRPPALGLRRRFGDEDTMSPGAGGYSGLSFTPPGSASDIMSPQSTMGYIPSPLSATSRNNPFSRTGGAPEAYRAHPHVPRLHLHDGTPRTLSEPMSTPLKSSSSYGGNSLDSSDWQLSSSQSVHGMQFVEPPRSVPPSGDHSSEYVTGNSNHYSSAYPSPASAHPRSINTSFPPPLGLSSSYKHDNSPLTPQTGTMSGFQSAPLAPPNDYHIPQMSAPADTTSFGTSYLTRSNTSGSPGQITLQAGRNESVLGGRSLGEAPHSASALSV